MESDVGHKKKYRAFLKIENSQGKRVHYRFAGA